MASRQTSEDAPLLVDGNNVEAQQVSRPPKLRYVILLLLLGKSILQSQFFDANLSGEFLSHSEATIMFAVGSTIASRLGDLKMAGWLVMAYTLGSSVAQPLCAKLADIFGRKSVLLWSYGMAIAGCALSAASQALWQIVLGRVVTGIGGAGIMIISAIVVADSVPKREIAQYRSYINTAATLGRSLGGPVGGFVMDAFGWQWVFWGRIPLFAISFLLLVVMLDNESPRDKDSQENSVESTWNKLRAIDGIGALLLSIAITSTLLLINQPSAERYGTPFLINSITLAISLPAFVLYELYGTKRPIFDLVILSKENVSLSYLIAYFQSVAQLSLMYSVPLYFQATQNASAAVAGAHLVPAVAANTVGSLLAGLVIRKTGRYKKLLVSTSFVGATGFLLLLLRWNGNTSLLESLYIMPGGFATGVVQSASFVAMAAFLGPNDISMATGMFFLVSSLGTAVGVGGSDRITQLFFQRHLESRLSGPEAAEVSWARW